ncbi:MAG: hypothetical protein WDL87_01980 [Candidatus Omnitrophota bacterium]|jgi:hypothetical protein
MSDELNLKVGINTTKVNRAMRLFPQELKFELADGMDHISRSFFKAFYKRRLSGPPGIRARPQGLFHWFKRRLEGQRIEISNRSMTTKRTGEILSGSTSSPLDMSFEIYTASKAAGIHERGGTISPGGMMPIPLPSQGQMFRQSGHLKENYKLDNMGKKLQPIRIRNHIYLCRVNRARHTIKPLYILLNKVVIKPRLGFYNTWNSLQGDRITILNKSVNKALDNLK